jgi:hypothetical protein
MLPLGKLVSSGGSRLSPDAARAAPAAFCGRKFRPKRSSRISCGCGLSQSRPPLARLGSRSGGNSEATCRRGRWLFPGAEPNVNSQLTSL